MKCVTTLKELVSSSEFEYLDNYDLVNGRNVMSFLSRYQAYRFLKALNSDSHSHVCFNPALNAYTIVLNRDYKEFKRCVSYVNRCYKYFERIGVL